MGKTKRIWINISGLFLLVGMPLALTAQQTLSLNECFDMATENYPLAKQSTYLKDRLLLDIDVVNKDKLPKLDMNAQASYQSDVTHLPTQLPNATIQPPNKDQYRATLDMNQLIYNGGLIEASAKMIEATNKVSQQEVLVNLYTLKYQINQLYHSILLVQENQNLLGAKQKQLQKRIEEVTVGVKYGTLLTSSADVLYVELLKIKQQSVELEHSRSGLLKRLSLLIGKELKTDVELQQSEVSLMDNSDSIRPESIFFDLQKEQLDYSSELLSKSKLPKINAFAQGGYGNPGLNMLDNSFKTFYITGLRLNWNVFDWNKTKTQKQSLQINKDIIITQKETFELNTNLELASLQSEIDNLVESIGIDHEIIMLREKILKTAESQLKNGIITSSEYVTEFTNLFDAKYSQNLHKTQLQLKNNQYQITLGTYKTNH